MTLQDLLQGRGHEDGLEDRGIEVEIGCGNGHFLVEYGAGKPDTLLVGIDRKEKRCQRAREKAEKRGLANVAILHVSAEMFLRELAPASVAAFHIYFPDPWPKSRHRKRRFFTMENLGRMYDLLVDGGRVYFGTDFFDYYIQAKVLVALHLGFRLTSQIMPPSALTSAYGRTFTGANKRLHLFSAAKTALSDEQREEQENQWDIERGIQPHEEG